MKEKMSRWGTGPIFASLSACYGMVTIVISRYFHPVFHIDFVPHWVLTILGILLIVIGIPFFIISAITVMRAYNADELVTDGIYRICRHPLYASWAVFIVPGITLLMKSWVVLTIPIFMYLILRQLVKKEEIYLESVFDSQYREYKKKVPCIMPWGWIKPFLKSYKKSGGSLSVSYSSNDEHPEEDIVRRMREEMKSIWKSRLWLLAFILTITIYAGIFVLWFMLWSH